MPVEIDAVERRIVSLEIEKRALQKEKTKEAKERLEEIEKAALRGARGVDAAAGASGPPRRNVIQKLGQIKEALEKVKLDAVEAERQGELQKVAELRYGRLPQLEKDLAAENARLAELQKGQPMLREEVTEEDIAAVVSQVDGRSGRAG